MLVDTHAHLTWESLEADLDVVLANAQEVGVERVISIATDLVSSRAAVDLSARYAGQVYAAVGVHPCDVFEIEERDWLEQISAMLKEPGVVAIGESGLDFYHPAPPEAGSEEAYAVRQEEFFRAQIELAIETGYPLVVHQRESLPEIIEVMKPYHGSELRAVFHCWNQSVEEARALIDLGHKVSFTGVVTFKNAALVQEAARELPAGSFMLETDAPFLAPVPYRGKRCQPSYTRNTAEFIAELRGVSVEKLAEETTSCAEEFFSL